MKTRHKGIYILMYLLFNELWLAVRELICILSGKPVRPNEIIAKWITTYVEVGNLCLVLLQVPKCFVLVQILCASPKIRLHLVPLQKRLCWHKNQFY